MLKVVFLDHCAKLSGGEIALLRLLPALLESVDPLVLLAEDGPLVGRLEAIGVPVEVLPLDPAANNLRKDTLVPGGFSALAPLKVAPYAWAVSRRLRSERADLVHTNSLKAAFYGGVAARMARVPQVWHLRDRVSADYLPGPAVSLVRAASRTLPAAVIAPSQSVLSTVPGGGVVVPDPLDSSQVLPRATREGALVLGVVGRLASWKGQHVALDAFARAALPGARLRLIGSAMFGEDDYEAQLRTQVADLGLQDRVELRGFREDVWQELAELDVLVHASTSPEPFGQVIVEGMAAGVPVIASNEGGPAEIVRDGVDGLLVPPSRPDLLAAAMTRLHDDAPLRSRLSAEGIVTAQRFSPSKAGASVVAVYEQVLGRGSSVVRSSRSGEARL